MKYVITFFALLLLAGCTDSATPTETAVTSPDATVTQAIANMKEWTSYESAFSSSSSEHPELDAYNSETAISYVKHPFQVAKRYKDNYFGGHFESYYVEETGFHVKNELGNQAWTSVNEPVVDNALIHAVADLLQLLVQEQTTLNVTINTAQLTVSASNFDAIRAALDRVNELRSKLATPQAILDNIYDDNYEPTDMYEQLDVTISFEDNTITNYSIIISRDAGEDDIEIGQIELSETFRSVNALQEIAVPTN